MEELEKQVADLDEKIKNQQQDRMAGCEKLICPIKNPVYLYAKEIRETTDIKELVQLLQTGDWIAICAVEKSDGSTLFSMIKTC